MQEYFHDPAPPILGKWQIWWLAARPLTLIATISPILIGTSLYFPIDFVIFFWTLLAGLSLQIGTNLANDYYDFFRGADTPNRKGPIRVTQSGLLQPRTVKCGFISAFCITALSTLFLIFKGGAPICLIGVAAIIFGLLYTAGPYSIAYLGLGELFVFLCFGLLATITTTYLQTGVWSIYALLSGMGPGALSSSILIINNLRDEQEDAQATKKTIVVRFGAPVGKGLYAACLLIALSCPLLFYQSHGALILLPTLLTIPAALLLRLLYHNNQLPYAEENKSPETSEPLETKYWGSLFRGTIAFFAGYTLLFCIAWNL
jgi:1,4-dihydroxy-2-naphthoate octaprenyltransferase